MSVSRTSNKSACIEPSELIIDVKFTDIFESAPGCNGYSGSRHSFYFKIYTNGNVIISRNNGLVDYELLRVNDNIPIPQFLVDVIGAVLGESVKYDTSKNNAQIPRERQLHPSCNNSASRELYSSHLLRMVRIVDIIKVAWKSEKTVQESMMKIKDRDIKILQKSINELQESNKNLSEENIIIANKNEIYKKHLNELQESVKKLYKLLFFLLLTLSVVPLICLRYFCE